MTSSAALHPILARLKGETRHEHEAIESALDLVSPLRSIDGYRLRLVQFRGLYTPMERALRAIDGWSRFGIDLDARVKTPWLDEDLKRLDVERPDATPECRDLPRLVDLADGFGCLYVLEGSTLGGRYVSRQVRERLGLTPETGGRFFEGYGEATMTMWRDFGAAVVAFAEAGGDQDRLVESALATFRTFRGWCRSEAGR